MFLRKRVYQRYAGIEFWIEFCIVIEAERYECFQFIVEEGLGCLNECSVFFIIHILTEIIGAGLHRLVALCNRAWKINEVVAIGDHFIDTGIGAQSRSTNLILLLRSH